MIRVEKNISGYRVVFYLNENGEAEVLALDEAGDVLLQKEECCFTTLEFEIFLLRMEKEFISIIRQSSNELPF